MKRIACGLVVVALLVASGFSVHADPLLAVSHNEYFFGGAQMDNGGGRVLLQLWVDDQVAANASPPAGAARAAAVQGCVVVELWNTRDGSTHEWSACSPFEPGEVSIQRGPAIAPGPVTISIRAEDRAGGGPITMLATFGRWDEADLEPTMYTTEPDLSDDRRFTEAYVWNGRSLGLSYGALVTPDGAFELTDGGVWASDHYWVDGWF